MLTEDKSFEYHQQALYCLSNCLHDDITIAKAILIRAPGVVSAIKQVIEQDYIHLSDLHQVSHIFVRLIEFEAYSRSDEEQFHLAYINGRLLRISGTTDSCQLSLMAMEKLTSGDPSETFMKWLLHGDTIELLFDIANVLRDENSARDPKSDELLTTIMGNISSVSDIELVQKFVTLGGLDFFNFYLDCGSMTSKAHAMWGLSNIACNSEQDAGLIIEKSELLLNIVSALNSPEVCMKREAYYVISNLLSTASIQDLVVLLDQYPSLLQRFVEGLSLVSGGADQKLKINVLSTL